MAENLTYLPMVSPSSAASYTEPYYYIYRYEGTDVATAKATDNYHTYGVLYNWPAAMAACPPGWHLPTDEEWKQLEMELGMTQETADLTGWRGDGESIKMRITSGWTNDGNGTNSSGFSILPAGIRPDWGGFARMGGVSAFWSATEYINEKAYYRSVYGNVPGAEFNSTKICRGMDNKQVGQSIRCVNPLCS